MIYSLPPKVGDTLTVTVEPADAEVTYKWTINGKGAVTTETYTVPADANSGDAIKVVVTDEDGNTAEDTVYVGGFTILKVEPTTDAATGDGEAGYKYIRAYFSDSLDSLDPEDIELRDKDTEQLYSIDTVKLSSDGTYADITLFGSVSEGGTTFLQPQTIYVMTVTNNEVSDSYEFELPMFNSNLLVRKVDIEKGTITIGARDYEVGDTYTDNLGTLVGRYVNVGVNSDNEVEKISLRKADVVYGVMKYVNKDGDPVEVGGDPTWTISSKDYFEDQVTKTKYYMTTEGTTTINESVALNVVTGEDMSDALIDAQTNYVKLVLNSNGTVATAVLDPQAWVGGTLRIADIDDTIVTETSKVNLDLDGYTIADGDNYVTPEDLEEGDLLFIDSDEETKFIEVYNDVVTGTPSDIDSTSIKIDGKSYKWSYKIGDNPTFAKYYNEDDDVYEELIELGSNVAAQKYLNSLDADLGVTVYLDRLGNIAYIDGIVEDDAVTTDTWYVTTSAGQGYTQALASYLKFKVSDGTEQTIEIPTSQLKSFNGVKGKIAEADDNNADKGNYKYKFTRAEGETKDAPFDNIIAANMVETGVLVKITRDEDDKIIGITFGGTWRGNAADTYDTILEIDGADDGALKPGVSKVTTAAGTTAKLIDDSVIWVYTVEDGGDPTVTKETFADYTKTTKTLDSGMPAPKVQVKGSAVTDVLLVETIADGASDTFTKGSTNTIEGIVTASTEKLNADKVANYVNTITVMDIDGKKTTYTAADESLAEPTNHTYISLKLDETTGEISSIVDDSNTWTGVSAVDTENSSTKAIVTLNNDTIKLADESLVMKRSGSTYTKTTLGQIKASTKDLKISWHDELFDADEQEHYADFVIVEEVEDADLVAEETALNRIAWSDNFEEAANTVVVTFEGGNTDGYTFADLASTSEKVTWEETEAKQEYTATAVANGGTAVEATLTITISTDHFVRTLRFTADSDGDGDAPKLTGFVLANDETEEKE